MKTYSVVSIVILLLVSNFAQSQDVVNNQTVVTTNTNNFYAFDLRDTTIEGSPYTQESFMPAKVSVEKGKTFSAKYNAITDEIEVESSKGVPQAINKYLADLSVTFLKDNKTYKAMTYFSENDSQVLGYLIPISDSESNIKLFLKETKVFVEGKPAKSSYQPAKPAKFNSLDDSYFIAMDNAIAKPLSNNKKDIASLFPKHEADILDYIKAEKLNMKKQDDLAKLFVYINQLTK